MELRVKEWKEKDLEKRERSNECLKAGIHEEQTWDHQKARWENPVFRVHECWAPGDPELYLIYLSFLLEGNQQQLKLWLKKNKKQLWQVQYCFVYISCTVNSDGIWSALSSHSALGYLIHSGAGDRIKKVSEKRAWQEALTVCRT